MLVTQFDVDAVRRAAAERVVRRVGMCNSDLMATSEIEAAVREKKPEWGRLLDDFRDAYREWYEFHHGVEARGLAGKLTQDLAEDLVARTNRRNESRNALIEALGQ